MKTNLFVSHRLRHASKSTSRNFLARIVAFVIFTSLSSSIFAEDVSFTKNGINYTIIEGTNTCRTTAGYVGIGSSKKAGNNVSGSISIPSNVNGYDVVEIGDYSFWKNNITSVSLPASIKRIGIQGLGDLPNLESVTFASNSVIQEIGQQAFELDYSLSEIKIPSSVVTIGESAFKDCTKLSKVTFSTPVKLTKIDKYAFLDCEALSSISLPNTLTTIGNFAFESTGLTSISVPSSVSSLGTGVFWGCENLVTATLPSGLTSVPNSTFSGCTKLKSAPLPESVTTIGKNAFYGCSVLNIFLPDKLTRIEESAFENCSSIETVYLKATVKSIGTNAYAGCTGLVAVYDEATTPQAVSSAFPVNVAKNANLIVYKPYIDLYKNSTYDWKNFGRITLIAVKAESITLDVTQVSLKVGETKTLTPTLQPITASEDITWSSSDAAVATVTNGEIEAKGVGTAEITATCDGKSATCKVTVSSVLATSVSLNKTTLSLKVNTSETLIATVLPETTTDKTIAWSSSNTAVATVDNSGKVTAIKSGSATITAKCGSVSATCTVTVPTVEVDNVSLKPTTAEILVGGAVTLTATVSPSYATNNTVAWTTSDAAIATVTNAGVVTGKSVGTATITATAGGKSATCIVTVKPILATGVNLSEKTLSLMAGNSKTITATIEPTNTTNKTVTWTSSNTAIATVDSNGKITAVGVGTAKITATCGSVSAECAVTVTSRPVESVTLSPATKTIKIGEYFTLTPTVKPDNATDKSVTYTLSPTGIVSMTDNVITGLKEGEVTITAKAGDKTATCVVTVKPVLAESVEIVPEEVTLNVDDEITLKATVLPTNTTNPAVTWSIKDPEYAKVDAVTGILTAIAPGTTTVTATCGSVSKTCVVTVNPVLAKTVTITTPQTQIMERDELQLLVTIAPENTTNKSITWSSSNPEVATVDQNGLVTALRVGPVTITAKSTANPTVSAKKQLEVVTRTRVIDGVIYELVYVTPGSSSPDDYIKAIGCADGEPNQGELTIMSEITTSKDRVLPVKEVDANAFAGNEQITSIVIPKTVMKVGEEAFANCTNLNEVRIDDSSEALECGDRMLENSPFKSLYLGRHVSGTILSGHPTLDNLEIGAKVDVIDANEFKGCAPITNLVVYAKTPPAMPANGFDESVYANTYLRVPDDKISAYEEAPGWEKFTYTYGINAVPAESISLSRSELTLTVGQTQSLKVTFDPADVTSKALTWSSSNEKVATVSSTGVIYAQAPGEVIITATTTNDKTAECKVTVNPIEVTSVTIEPDIAEITVGDVFSLSASVDPDDATDQTITWTTSDATVATVDEDGNVTALAPGTVTITATSPDGPSADCSITVVLPTIDVKDIVLDAEEMRLFEGTYGVLKLSIYPGNATDKSVVWSSSTPEVATVDDSGKVTAIKRGTTVITATTLNGKSAQCTVTVIPKVIAATDVTLNLSQVELLQWEEVQLIATLTPAESDEIIVWSTTDMIVANVDDNGKVTSYTPGTVTITATTSSGASASCIVKVVAAPTGVEFEKSDVDVLVGGELQLNAEVTPSEAAAHKLVWRSSNPEIATVDMQGKVKGIAPGTTTITVRTVNNLEVSCTVNVTIAPTSIALNFTHYELPEMDRLQLIAMVEPSGMSAGNIMWSSSDPTVVSVTGDGCINTFMPGSAIITATTPNGLSATCEVTVEGYDVRLNVLSATLYRGEQLPMTARVTPAKGYYAGWNWTSSDEAVATVDNDGVVTGIEAGATYINYYVGTTGYDYCPVMVIDRNPVEEGPEITFSEVAVRPGQSLDLGSNVDPEVTWTSSDESVIKVDDYGNIVAVGEGEAEIVATDATGTTSTCTVVVATKVPLPVMEIYFNGDQTLPVGETLQLLPELYPYEAYNKTLTYTSSDPDIVSVDADGVITALRPGEAMITATTSNGLTATCMVFVDAKPSAIDGVEDDGQVSVRVENQDIVVEAPADADVEVYAITGTLVHHTRDHRIVGLTPGVYIVRVARKSFKVSL